MSCEIMQNLLLLITYDTSLPSAYLLQYSSYLLSNDGLPPFSIPQTNLATSIQTFTYLPPCKFRYNGVLFSLKTAYLFSLQTA